MDQDRGLWLVRLKTPASMTSIFLAVTHRPGGPLRRLIDFAGDILRLVGRSVLISPADDAVLGHRQLEDDRRLSLIRFGDGEDAERQPFGAGVGRQLIAGRRRGTAACLFGPTFARASIPLWASCIAWPT